MNSDHYRLPDLVVHADWSKNPRKRWMAIARLSQPGKYNAEYPSPAGDTGNLLLRLSDSVGKYGTVLLGFDFPIGLPLKFAQKLGVSEFLELLPQLGQGKWRDFYSPAETAEQIRLTRPFYPQRPGGKKQSDLVEALGMISINDLRRRCELAHASRRAAAPLFWTIGAQQVGKAAISGWREVLGPGMHRKEPNLFIWPFSGELVDLLKVGRIVVAETYPAEIYSHLGISFPRPGSGKKGGKRDQKARSNPAKQLFEWARHADVTLSEKLQAAIRDGFGPTPNGEDLFDASIGLLGLLNVILGFRSPGEPRDDGIRKVEGWILGQDYEKGLLYNLNR
jgi:hypothetical protein